MVKKASKYYWFSQLGGWLFLWGFNLVLAYSVHQKVNWRFLLERSLFVTSGILVTHLFRTIMVRFRWLQYSLDKLIWRLLLAISFCSVAIVLLIDGYNQLFHFLGNREGGFQLSRFLGTFFLVMVWTMIYILWYYFQKDQRYQIDQLKLESTLKELELKTIKSQLNPHFIFNALNSIRALIDENPNRARMAITELSNILRNSMQAEKVEMVSLENEISIVRDYLALENIRFEERLEVHYDIQPETLQLPVPPMMLQTLVENAVKHGISKMVAGGVVNISSRILGKFHEIKVQNTGHIQGEFSDSGFGLQSTRQRLGILFGDSASFQISNLDDRMVEVRIRIPLPDLG